MWKTLRNVKYNARARARSSLLQSCANTWHSALSLGLSSYGYGCLGGYAFQVIGYHYRLGNWLQGEIRCFDVGLDCSGESEGVAGESGRNEEGGGVDWGVVIEVLD